MGCDVVCPFTVSYPTEPGKPDRKEYFTVPARAVRVFSSALLAKKIATLARIRVRDQRAAQTFIRDATKRAYACEEDAQRAAKRDGEAQQRTTLNLTTSIKYQEGPYQRGRGRPRKHAEPGILIPHWRIIYTVVPVDDAVAKQRLVAAASFIIIRTATPGWTITDVDMIHRYKGQYHNEHGFSWLKSGAALNPIFLKTPHRIASLGFIYCIGLMIWALIQRTVRANLNDTKRTLPYHRGRKGTNISTRFIFELFQNVQSQHLAMPDGVIHHFVHGINGHAARACRALGTKLIIFKPRTA
jgi:transposase